MSLRNKFFSILAVAIGIVGFSTFTLAQDNQGTTPAPQKSERHSRGEGRGWNHDKGAHGGYGRGGDMMHMLHDLDLTEAQKTQIHSIMEANRPDQATMEEMRTLGKAKHDGTLTTEQEARLSTLWAQSKEKRQSIHQQILAVLTPDQLAKLEQKKQERKQRREQHQRQDQQSPTTQDN